MPLVYNKTTEHGASIGVWHITESTDVLRQMVELNDEDAQRVASFVRDKRRSEWLAVRVLAKHLLGTSPQIGYFPNGAPYLADSPLKISITHTQGFAAVALHPTHVVGIDMEYPSQRILKISDRFMNDHEAANTPANNAVAYQTVCWCAKEALYKWWGQADVVFKDELLLQPFTISQPEFTIEAETTRNGTSQHVKLTGIITTDYILTYIDTEGEIR